MVVRFIPVYVCVHMHDHTHDQFSCTRSHTHKTCLPADISIFCPKCVMRVHTSYSRDNQWGGEEQRPQQAAPTVCVLPLPLMHLATAVVTAAAHAEEEADDWHEDGEQQAHRRTY